MMKTTLFLLLILLGFATSSAGASAKDDIYSTPEKSGGVYYAYPNDAPRFTAPPEGFTPFYISHYGRHGSRYLISEEDYSRPLEIFRNARDKNVLSALGEDVLNRLEVVSMEAKGRAGELTPLGARQHSDIARRMFEFNPDVFVKDAEITAASTQVMRCAHSMFAFVNSLNKQNPSLQIPLESCFRNMDYLCYSTPESWAFNDDKREPWREQSRKFKQTKTNSERFVSSLINDPDYIERAINPDKLMWDLFWLAADMQNMETNVSFYDLFEPEELYNLWQANNFEFYATNSSFPRSNGVNVDNAKHLLTNILETANRYIEDNKKGATLRFGHDGNITPLSALMQLDGFHGYANNPEDVENVWQSYYISPMAANLQMIFYKNTSGDIIVKFMMNENEVSIPIATHIFPFYNWNDVKPFLEELISTPSADFMPQEMLPNHKERL